MLLLVERVGKRLGLRVKKGKKLSAYGQSRSFDVVWTKHCCYFSIRFPGVAFAVFFILNLFIWYTGSSGAVPFTTMFSLLLLWFGISVPLVFVGAYIGYKRDTIELPVRTNAIPRHIPTQPWFTRPVITSLIGGVLPFGAVFTELFFILS